MEIRIPENLQQMVHSVIFSNDKFIKIKFTEDYDNKEIVVPFTIKDLHNSLRKLEKKVKESISISSKEYNELEDGICSYLLDNDLVDTTQSNNKNKVKREVTVNKYSQNRKGNLYESIILDGEPCFISIDDNDKLTFETFIEEKTRILYPPSMEEYLHEPYDFRSKDDIVAFIQRARKETIFSLYEKGKSIVSKYIDQEEHIISLANIDLIFSYFQDRFPTVHYLGIFGDNNSGKSSIGDVFEALGYRTVNTTDPSPANIFRSLGPVEPGQITLVLDEAEKVD
jgi:predicted ribosome-associated RNA-binding protein Tma20